MGWLLALLLLAPLLLALPCRPAARHLHQHGGGYEDEDEERGGVELLEVEEQPVRPWVVVPMPMPMPMPRVTKKALTVLARWRPLSAYVQAAASAQLPPDELLLLLLGGGRGKGRKSLRRQRPRVQPLRWGRRKRAMTK